MAEAHSHKVIIIASKSGGFQDQMSCCTSGIMSHQVSRRPCPRQLLQKGSRDWSSKVR